MFIIIIIIIIVIIIIYMLYIYIYILYHILILGIMYIWGFPERGVPQ